MLRGSAFFFADACDLQRVRGKLAPLTGLCNLLRWLLAKYLVPAIACARDDGESRCFSECAKLQACSTRHGACCPK